MNNDSYEALAANLKTLPLGFPSSPSGVEMRILRKLYSPKEARVAAAMRLGHESPAQIAEKLGEQSEDMTGFLEMMLSKGLIDGRGSREHREYRIVPYLNIHGDLPVSQLDSEYVEFFEQYLAEVFAQEMGKASPPNIRVFPAEQTLPEGQSVLSFEQVSEMVSRAKYHVTSDCPCCKKMKLLGRDCGRRAHRCISLFYADESGPDIRVEYRDGRRSSKQEVLSLLKILEDEGFIHTGSNIQDGHSHICNCCPDCCPFLRMVRLKKAPYIVAPSNYVAAIDDEKCIACGLCAEERCPVNAIELTGDHYQVNSADCIGCGACAITCPSGAMALQKKEADQLYIPPGNFTEWVFHRSRNERLMMQER